MGSVSIDGLADAIMDELLAYSDEVAEQLKEEVIDSAKECVKEIKNSSPKLTGDYKKGWRVKKAYESRDDIRVIIHNPKEYPLTHLLEHGHAKRGGGRVEGIPHIGPAEKRTEKKLLKKVKISIIGGKS